MELMETYTTIENSRKNDAYESAKKKVASLRGFHKHFMIYILVNLFISFRGVFDNMEAGTTIKNALSDGDVYSLWIVWGFIILIHGMNVFSRINIFGHKWEERKIKEYMNEDTRNSK